MRYWLIFQMAQQKLGQAAPPTSEPGYCSFLSFILSSLVDVLLIPTGAMTVDVGFPTGPVDREGTIATIYHCDNINVREVC